MDTNTHVNQGLPQRRPPWTFNLSSCSHTTVSFVCFSSEVAPRASPSSKVLLLSLLAIALWLSFACTPRWAFPLLDMLCSPSPLEFSFVPMLYLCSLISCSCPCAGQMSGSVSYSFPLWACLPGGFLCCRSLKGLNVAPECDLS